MLDCNARSELGNACSVAFGESIDLETVETIVSYCLDVGERISGRTAGKIEDLVIRYLFRYYACFNDSPGVQGLCHIEIGVLFGAGVIFACEATRSAGRRIPVVAIDPFEGYYGAHLDPVSKLEVTVQRFRDNLALFELEDEVEVVRGFSDDPEVYEPYQTRRVASLLVDGSHSYEGVLSDWRRFGQLVVPGGYVLLDDYNNPSWPEVTRCIDAEILPALAGDWSVRLAFGRSLLLQRTAGPHQVHY